MLFTVVPQPEEKSTPAPGKSVRNTGALALAIHLACAGLAASATVTLPMLLSSHANAQGNVESQARIAFNIPAGSLSEALNRFAEQTGLYLSAAGELTNNKTSSGLKGEYTVADGLQQLLAGSGIRFRFSGENTVTLMRESRGATTLPPVKISANTIEASAYEPVEGYSATRSATGTRMDVALIDTPVSIQVIPEAVIEDQNASRLGDVVRNVSGIRVDSTAGNRSESFNIRGFKSLRLARDGFLSPASFGDSSFVELANISRVEALKGPASILYGQAEPGGLINLVTKKPSQESFGKLSGSYGTDDYKLIEVDLNQSLNAAGTLLGRINTSYQDGGAFRDHPTDPKQLFIAPSLRWLPTDHTVVDLQLEYSDQERAYDRGLVAKDGSSLMALPRERYLGESYSTTESEDQRARISIEHQFNDQWALRALVQTTESEHPIKAVNPVSLQADDRTLNRNYQEVLWETENYGIQVNLTGNFTTGDIEHELLIGADANQTNLDMQFSFGSIDPINIYAPVYGATPEPFNFFGGQARDIDFYGVYINDLITLNPHWKVMLGGRYDAVKTNYQANGNVLTDQKVDREFSPRAGLIFKPMDDTSFYASYTESFIPPLSGASVNGEEFKPEEGEQIELGVKREWWEGRLSTTASLFELTRSNVSTSDPMNAGFSIQTGEQRSRGLEIDVSGELSSQWKVLASFSWIDTEITADNTYDEGNELPNAPKLSGSFWSTYSFVDGPLSDWEMGAGVFASGEREGSLDNTFSVPGYATVDFLARYLITPDLRFSLNVKNLFNKYYIESTGGRLTWIEPGAPRTLLAKIDWTF